MIKTTELDLSPLITEQNDDKIEFTEIINFVETSQPDIVASVIDDKDQQIAELKKQLEEKDKNCLALFSALYSILEKQDPENVSSRIDFLTKQDNGKINDIYKEYQILKKQLEVTEQLRQEVLNEGLKVVERDSEKIEELQKQLKEKDKVIEIQKSIQRYDIGEMLTENTKLKHQLHTQPREIMEKIKDLAGDYFYITGENNIALSGNDFTEILEKILKEYGENDEQEQEETSN